MSRKYASSHEHLHQASRSLFWLLYRRFKSSPPQRREKLSKIDLLSRTSATLRKILTVCTAFSVQNFSAWPAGLVGRNLMKSPRIFMSHRVNPWTSAMSASRYLNDSLKGKGDNWLPQLPFIKPKWPRIAVVQVQVPINF
jgi:hypothetical protein